MTRITSRDVALGRVQPVTGQNGVPTPPGLLVNSSTIPEHQARLAREGRRLMSRAEAVEWGYPPDEVAEFFDRPPAPEPTSEVSKFEGR